MRDALLGNGTFVDIALVALLLELTVLTVLARRGRTRMRILDIIGQVAAGAFLLAALRVALAGGDIVWVAALMTASLPAHVLDLTRRASAAAQAVTTTSRERR